MGPDQKGNALCYEHADQTFVPLLGPRARSSHRPTSREAAFEARQHLVEEIDSDETERILNCAAAVDVAKASGMVCVRRPHPSIEGRRLSRVWEVGSTTNSILALGDDLVVLGVERVVVESTSDYWRPFSTFSKRPG